MNKNALEAEMREHGENGTILAKALGMARSTFSAKINETNGAEFTQGEMTAIKARYTLSPERMDEIFFAPKVS